MADTPITLVSLDKDVSYRQAQMPVHVYGVYEGDDTDYHVLIVDGRGKSRMSYGVDNETNKTVTVTLYGAHSATAVVGGAGVFAIDVTGSFTVATATTGYETNNDPFPFYLIRTKFADVPDGENVTVYVDIEAF